MTTPLTEAVDRAGRSLHARYRVLPKPDARLWHELTEAERALFKLEAQGILDDAGRPVE